MGHSNSHFEQNRAGLEPALALVIVQTTKCGVRRLVAAFRAMRRQVAALQNSPVGLNDDQGPRPY
ncbi:MAG: hypothetical protein DM484_19705 [Candidatus Methylumidiphilus alinenensis]|uniref:Uncharacterized protein n=1 Tax=Candidatus Methylumidiphilus alinenensis TaxID=2202197 RepID=A0A2W4SWS0_9GAMM|nr:MAG: hypothetical protein DM484_19705 [Candidatus Methylumidiphilus alinenensis]